MTQTQPATAEDSLECELSSGAAVPCASLSPARNILTPERFSLIRRYLLKPARKAGFVVLVGVARQLARQSGFALVVCLAATRAARIG